MFGRFILMLLVSVPLLAQAQTETKTWVWSGTQWINAAGPFPVGAVQITKGAAPLVWNGEIWVDRSTWENGVTANDSVWTGSAWIKEVPAKNLAGYLKFPPDGTLRKWTGSAWERTCHWLGVQLIDGKAWRKGQWVSRNPRDKTRDLSVATSGCAPVEFVPVAERTPASDPAPRTVTSTPGWVGKGQIVGTTSWGGSSERSNTWGTHAAGGNAWSGVTAGIPTSGIPTSGIPTSGLPTDGGIETSGIETSGLPTDGGIPTSGIPTSGIPTSGLATVGGGWGLSPGGPSGNGAGDYSDNLGGGPTAGKNAGTTRGAN